MKTSILLAVAAFSCTTLQSPRVRFVNSPPVTVVNDRRDVPRPPVVHKYLDYAYHFDESFYYRLLRPLSVPEPQRAVGVNAVDEVPDSTWFTNRIGVRDLTPEEVFEGPTELGSPEHHKPWTIRSTKTEGENLGFHMTDARGVKYLLKFDFVGHPEVETATAVIVNRLLWAAGYNVPEDHVAYVRFADLVVAPDAVIEDPIDGVSRLTRGEVHRRLRRVPREPDGRIRVFVSRIIEGKPLGGHPGRGVREDDPNDVIPHQLRRDLRGAHPLYSWLDHIDLKESNSLDTWIADPANPRRHYVVHYLVDLGGAMGANARIREDKRRGQVYAFDVSETIEAIASLGLGDRPWVDRSLPPYRGLGLFDAASYDVGAWQTYTSSYQPVQLADRIDKYWGAKLVMRFTPAQIRAAVTAAKLSDPAAAEYLVKTLLARQRMTARYWFERTNPLDRFQVLAARGGGHVVCFDDLLLSYGLAPELAASTTYTVTTRDANGRLIVEPIAMRANGKGRACTPRLALANERSNYTILELATTRGDRTLSTSVHLARDPRNHAPRVVGIWRE